MEAVYGWVKNIIYYVIFISVVNNLLADTKYEKYLRFFSGMVLILVTAGPLLDGFGLERQLTALFEQISFQNDAEQLQQELLGMEKRRQQEMVRAYEMAVEEDLMQLAREQGFSCLEARAVLNEDERSPEYGAVESVFFVLKKSWKEGHEAAPVMIKGEGEQKIRVELSKEDGESGMGQGKSAEAGAAIWESEIPGTEGLTGKVEQIYEVEASDIEIQWEDD